MSTFIELLISDLSHIKQEILHPIISKWNHAGHYKRHGKEWIFYFEKEAFQEKEITQILEDEKVSYEWAEKTFQLDSKLNWNGMYQPVLINDYCYIRTPIHPDDLNNCKHQITIIPTMTFGMGDHITTKLMLKEMEKLNFQNKVVLDAGTGTGILSIVALKEGAKKAIGFDTEPLSPTNAIQNAKLNDVNLKALNGTISVLKEPVAADYILANISTPAHLSSVKKYYLHLNPDGILMLSGVLNTDLAKIKTAFEPNGFTFIEAVEDAGWLVVTFIKKPLN